jgi:hypothetical protein
MLNIKLSMKTEFIKTPLPFDQYNKFQIDPSYDAYQFVVDHIKLERSDELEDEIRRQGFKIYHSDITIATKGMHTLTVIAAKLRTHLV